MQTLSAPDPDESKPERYARLARECSAILAQIDDPVTAMAIVAAQVFANVPGTSWAGFYRRVAPGLLRVGPYRGPLPCLPFAACNPGMSICPCCDKYTRVMSALRWPRGPCRCAGLPGNSHPHCGIGKRGVRH